MASLFSILRRVLPYHENNSWTPQSPDVVESITISSKGSAAERPTYAAMLRFDLADSGTIPRPVLPPQNLGRKQSTRSSASTQVPDDNDDNETVSRTSAIDYALSGRHDPSHTFCDLRSGSKARRRHRTRLDKYYSYKGVNPGQVGTEHYLCKPIRGQFTIFGLLDVADTTIMTPHQLYQEAQCWPRPPTYSRSPRGTGYYRGYGWTNKWEQRMCERKHTYRMLLADARPEVPTQASCWAEYEFQTLLHERVCAACASTSGCAERWEPKDESRVECSLGEILEGRTGVVEHRDSSEESEWEIVWEIV